MNPSIKAIFFDIGGTLRTTPERKKRDPRNIEEMIALLGEKCTVDEFISKIHKGEKAYRKWGKPSHYELNEADIWTRFLLPEYPADFVREHAVALNQLWRLSIKKYILPDMPETIKTLARRGYRLGLISNTTSSVEGPQILAEYGLTDLFSTVVLSAVFGRRKPHPSIFLAAAREAGVHPSECAYVGDRPSRDLIGARQSGYGKVVIINTESNMVDEYDPDDYDPEKDTGLTLKPDHFIRKLSQMLDIFPDLNSSKIETGHVFESDILLYDAALSTMWGVDQDMPFLDTFEAARKIGLSRFELNHKITHERLDLFKSSPNYAVSIHDPCPADLFYDEMKQKDILISSLDDTRRRECVDMVKRTIDLAEQLGSRNIVVHTGSVVCDRSRDRHLRKMYEQHLKGTNEYNTLLLETIAHRDQHASAHIEQVLKSLQQIIAHAEGSGIAIGLENRYRYYDIPLPHEMARFLELSGQSWYGFHYDTGHGQALDALGYVSQAEWLEQFSGRMVGVHLHDVRGITDHQVPGTGDVNFTLISSYLPENTWRTLEIGSQASIAEIASGLEFLAKSGCILKL